MNRDRSAKEPAQLRALGARASASLESAREAFGAAERVRARILRGDLPRDALRVERFRPRLAVVAAAALVAFTVLVSLQFASVRPLTFHASLVTGHEGDFIAASAAPVPLTFSDGTSLRVLDSAQVRVAELRSDGARVVLEHGRIEAHVIHRSDTRWTINAGPFEVRVTGTRFALDWDASSQAMVVTLVEGAVEVSGCRLGEARRVAAGETLRVSCAPVVVAEVPPSAALPKETPPPAPTALSPAERRTVAPTKPDKAELPRIERARGTADADSLLKLANDARYSGDFVAARERFTDLRGRFPASAPAALAAFELGRMAFDVDADYRTAGDWFDRYLNEAPRGGLTREAQGRLLEARFRSKDADRALRAAAKYLLAYPEGPHARLARRVLDGEAP
ncbi:MAG: FecR domain-containing protein [Myxococcales bacterium]|nr:FecR domain-containing protein [Myxococcales bacterium]